MSRAFIARYANLFFFVGGFLFDSLTLVRIDSVIDLSIQAVYLLAITALLVVRAKIESGRLTLKGRLAKKHLFFPLGFVFKRRCCHHDHERNATASPGRRLHAPWALCVLSGFFH